MASRALEGVTNRLDAWAVERGLTFSRRKTVSMPFRKRNKELIEIMLRNEIIPSKESTQFLGMAIDSRLNWEEHTVLTKLRANAKRALSTIKVVAGKKWVGDRKTLKKLYIAICRTKIDYGCQLYKTAFAVRLKKLDIIHREGL